MNFDPGLLKFGQMKSGLKRSGLPSSSTKGHESEVDIMIGN